MDEPIIISTYTDAQAVDDGILVRLNRRDCVTRTVFEFLAAHTPLGPEPPDRWPVSLMVWFGAKGTEQEQRDRKAVALATGLIGAHDQQARRVYEENIGGGIWKGYALMGRFNTLDRFVVALPEKRVLERDVLSTTTLWLIPNELGGLTLMFPEDY